MTILKVRPDLYVNTAEVESIKLGPRGSRWDAEQNDEVPTHYLAQLVMRNGAEHVWSSSDTREEAEDKLDRLAQILRNLCD